MSLLQFTPELIVADVDKSVDFYINILGFEKIEGDSHFACLRAGTSEIMLMLKSDFDQEIPDLNRPQNSGWSILNIEVSDIKTLHENLENKVSICRSFRKTDYGTEEFTVTDLDGYLIQLTQRFVTW